jgi:hypothetical protein
MLLYVLTCPLNPSNWYISAVYFVLFATIYHVTFRKHACVLSLIFFHVVTGNYSLRSVFGGSSLPSMLSFFLDAAAWGHSRLLFFGLL